MTISAFEIEAEAFAMFDKWQEMFLPEYEGDILEIATLYAQAPAEQHAAAAAALGLTDPRKR